MNKVSLWNAVAAASVPLSRAFKRATWVPAASRLSLLRQIWTGLSGPSPIKPGLAVSRSLPGRR